MGLPSIQVPPVATSPSTYETAPLAMPKFFLAVAASDAPVPPLATGSAEILVLLLFNQKENVMRLPHHTTIQSTIVKKSSA